MMGSLTSTPKIPQRQTVYVPAPTSVISPTVSTKPIDKSSAADIVSDERKKSLLARSRGRFGTIATSLQGFLADDKQGGRKTLLGE